MNWQENTTCNNQTLFNNLLMSTALLFLPVGATALESLSTNSTSYHESMKYDSLKQSTLSDSLIKNDVDMLKILEISKLNEKITQLYGTSIIESWIPADGILDKTCLFIKVNEQERFMAELDFELDLYLKLEPEIKDSSFFNMIALM